MTSLVTEQVYRTTMKDLRSPVAEILRSLDDAQKMIEERVGRKLAYGSYTETLSLRGSVLLTPRMTPLDPATPGYVDSVTLRLVTGAFNPYVGGIAVTYLGGWTAATLPIPLQQGICLLAKHLIMPGTTGQGQMIKMGDMTFSEGEPAKSDWPAGVWGRVRRYRPLVGRM